MMQYKYKVVRPRDRFTIALSNDLEQAKELMAKLPSGNYRIEDSEGNIVKR